MGTRRSGRHGTTCEVRTVERSEPRGTLGVQEGEGSEGKAKAE